ncbi:MAG: hypothetical protein ACRDT6_24125 [Micromonosporaceae bacterium]
MGPYDETATADDETAALKRRMLNLETRLLELESEIRTERRMLVPACVVTAGLALAFASFGLISGADGDQLGSWAALFLVYAIVMVPLTVLTVMSRSAGMRGAAIVAWVMLGMMAVCLGASPRGALAALGIGPWYLLGSAAITIVGLTRMPTRSSGD